MKNRPLTFWLITSLALLCCLAYPFNWNTETKIQPLNVSNLVKVEPKFLFYTNNQFHLNVKGELTLNLNSEKLDKQLLDYDVLVLNRYQAPHNIETFFNWQVGDVSHSIAIHNNQTSINKIDFNTEDFSAISNLQIQFVADLELGNDHRALHEVMYQSIYFDHSENIGTTSINNSQWFRFNPLKVISINNYSSLDLQHLNGLLIRLAAWLFIAYLTYLSLNMNGKHLVLCVIVAWAIMFVPFSVNYFKQHKHLKQVYAESNYQFLNNLDEDASRMANSINYAIENNQDLYSQKNKYILVGFDEFFRLRLLNHLNHLSIAYDYRIESEPNVLDSKKVYIIRQNVAGYCANLLKQPAHADFQLLSEGESYCMVKQS